LPPHASKHEAASSCTEVPQGRWNKGCWRALLALELKE